MSPEQAIRAQYGVRLGPSSGDGKHRLFRIDQFRNGYLIKLSGAALFGSVIDGERFEWCGGDFCPTDTGKEQKDNAAIRFEWLVWHIAKAAVDRGEKLNQVDSERLKLAVQRLESWL